VPLFVIATTLNLQSLLLAAFQAAKAALQTGTDKRPLDNCHALTIAIWERGAQSETGFS
jgi:hypothetical protein